MNLWTLLANKLQTNQLEISIQEFDGYVFPDHLTSSQLSRTRKKLLKEVNTMFDFEFLTTTQSRMDKRYRVIKIQAESMDFDISLANKEQPESG